MKIFLALMFFVPTFLYSQLTVQISNFNATNMPYLSADISAKLNNSPVELGLDNIVLSEKNYPNQIISISPLVSDKQHIVWIPNFDKIEEDSIYNTKLIAIYNYNSVSVPIVERFLAPRVNCFDINGQRISSMYFGKANQNTQVRMTLSMRKIRGPIDSLGFESPVVVDSITSDNSQFIVNDSISSNFGYQFTPLSLVGSFTYNFDIIFKPTSTNFASGNIIIHYSSGGKKVVKVSGNEIDYPILSNLQLVQPNGKEILVPCQDYVIKWKGHNASKPVNIYVSWDFKKTWEKINTVVGSEYIWKLPSKINKFVFIRVNQDFSQSDPFEFSTESYNNLKFNQEASKLLAYTSNKEMKQWDVSNWSNTQNFKVLTGSGYISGANYYNNDEIITTNNSTITTKNYISRFLQNNSNFVKQYEFSKYNIVKSELDIDRNRLYVYANLGNFLDIIDLQTDQIVKTLTFDKPIFSFAISKVSDIMVVYKINGELEIIRASDFTLIKKLFLYDTPLIMHSALSPNGRFYAFASISAKDGQATLVDILDTKTGEVFANIRSFTTNCVGLSFSPNSNTLLIGSEIYPQVLTYDITTKQVQFPNWPILNNLTNLSYSSKGSAIATASAGSLVYGEISNQEFDLNDTSFSVEAPKMSSSELDFGSRLVFTKNKIKFSGKFCNISEVPYYIDKISLKNSYHFQIDKSMAPDTIWPGECKDIELIFNPKDVGIVTDSLIFEFCDTKMYYKIFGNGLPRNAQFTQNPFYFGEQCIGDTLFVDLDLITNKDTADIYIDDVRSIGNKKHVFTILSNPVNKLLKPNETLKIRVAVSPDTLGLLNSKFLVEYEGQSRYSFEGNFSVKGIGTYVELSHDTLAFIPEVLNRKIKIKNIGVDKVVINDIITYPIPVINSIGFSKTEILAGQEKEFEFSWNGDTLKDAYIRFDATPCLVQKFIPVQEFKAFAKLTIKDVLADPREDAEIEVFFDQTEKPRYKGIRPFEGIIRINSELFYPESATSQLGNAKIELIGNDLKDRLFKVKIDGDFGSNTGTLLKIKGKAGISDTLISSINFDKNSTFFGKNEIVSSNIAKFEIIDFDKDSRVSKTTNLTSLNSINVISENNVNFDFSSTIEQSLEITIYDFMGTPVKSIQTKINKGNSEISINDISLISGTYFVLVQTKNSTIKSKFSFTK